MTEFSDNLELLDPEKHYLGWLGDDPRQAFRVELERLFVQQSPGSKLEQVVLTSAPKYVTGAKPSPDRTKTFLVRTALAAPFHALVREGSGTLHEVVGVFTWAAANLHVQDGRCDRIWLDLFDDADRAFELLKVRVYEVSET